MQNSFKLVRQERKQAHYLLYLEASSKISPAANKLVSCRTNVDSSLLHGKHWEGQGEPKPKNISWPSPAHTRIGAERGGGWTLGGSLSGGGGGLTRVLERFRHRKIVWPLLRVGCVWLLLIFGAFWMDVVNSRCSLHGCH